MPKFVIEIESIADADYFQDLLTDMVATPDPDIIATWSREDYPKSLFLKIIPED